MKQTVSDFTVGVGFVTTIPVLSALLGCVIESWVQDNEKMKNLFRSLKGKLSGYTDSEKKEKKIKITKPKQIIEMMIDMLEVEK